jgi:hypothetical protein
MNGKPHILSQIKHHAFTDSRTKGELLYKELLLQALDNFVYKQVAVLICIKTHN